jgi:hypothetical protein
MWHNTFDYLLMLLNSFNVENQKCDQGSEGKNAVVE